MQRFAKQLHEKVRYNRSVIELQRLLLGDRLRNEAFIKALKAVIVPGETVIADIGSGTGYLSFLAEKLGAKECHLYEVNEDLLGLSKNVAKQNGIKRCSFNPVHSTAVKNPPKADVVISETLGNFAYEENIIETLHDARRFLKPGGVMIPQSLTQFIAPVISPRLYDDLNVWDTVDGDLDLSAAKEVCMNNMYVKDVRGDDLWGKGVEWDRVDFTKNNDSIRGGSAEWCSDNVMTVYGWTLWWQTQLIDGITLSTSPFGKQTHWKQIFLPLVEPVTVKKGETICATVHSDSRYKVKINVMWETLVKDGAGKVIKTVKQDMKKGYLS